MVECTAVDEECQQCHFDKIFLYLFICSGSLALLGRLFSFGVHTTLEQYINVPSLSWHKREDTTFTIYCIYYCARDMAARCLSSLVFILACWCLLGTHALPPINYAVNTTVIVGENPPSIELNWEGETCTSQRTCSSFMVTKSVYDPTSLTARDPSLVVGNFNGSVKTFVDTDVQVGVIYEYIVCISKDMISLQVYDINRTVVLILVIGQKIKHWKNPTKFFYPNTCWYQGKKYIILLLIILLHII